MKVMEHEFAKRNARVVLLSCDTPKIQQDWSRDIMDITRERHLVDDMMGF
jgi:alkyl hydroperoxide reductase subunit AhpC